MCNFLFIVVLFFIGYSWNTKPHENTDIIACRCIKNGKFGEIVHPATNKMALQFCVERNNCWDILQPALKKQPSFDINQTDNNGWNVLHSLALSHHETLTKLTIKMVNNLNGQANTQIADLINYLKKNEQLAKYLIQERGIKKDQNDINGYTPYSLYFFMTCQPCHPSLKERREWYLKLLES